MSATPEARPPESATLVISGQKQDWQVELPPKGVLVGRDSKCGVALDDARISRRHATIFRDPFGRWIIEDLRSRNGVWVGGRRVDAAALGSGDRIEIGPFHLTLIERPSDEIAPDPRATVISTTLSPENSTEQLTVVGSGDERPLSVDRIKQLNEITERLTSLGSPAELYPEACRCLAWLPRSAAVVLRVPRPDRPLPEAPQVIACRVLDEGGTAAEGPQTRLCLSRRVLEGVRSQPAPVRASSGSRGDVSLELTVVDDRQPRSVVAATISEVEDGLDVLYTDLPGDCGDDVVDFVLASARQIGFARKSLLLAEARAERRSWDHQLALARQIQSKLTPRREVLGTLQGADVSVCYRPALWVGGDYCDVWPLADRRVAFAVGDVAGKGLHAAMVMTMLHAALRTTMAHAVELREAVGSVNELMRENLPEGLFVTLFVGLFDPSAGRLSFVNAGHLPPLRLGAGRAIEVVREPANLPVGVVSGSFDVGAATLGCGEGLVVFTDGITEARSPADEEFGYERLRAMLAGDELDSAEAVTRRITDGADAFRQHGPQQDDVTVFTLVRSAASTAHA